MKWETCFLIEVFFFGSSLFSFRTIFCWWWSVVFCFIFLDSLLVSSLLLSFYTSILSTTYESVGGC